MSNPADYYDLSRIRPEVQAVLRRINELGPLFVARAVGIDIDASFPVENYKDLADAGVSGPVRSRRNSAAWGFRCSNTPWWAPRSPNICGATALTFNMHNVLDGVVAVHV